MDSISDRDGTSGLVAILSTNLYDSSKSLTVGSAGDCTAILVNRNDYIELTCQHKPDRRDEFDRIN